MIASKLHEAIAAVCPIDGVSIGRKADKTTWRIDFKDAATEQQRMAARIVMDGFDVAVAEAKMEAAKVREAAVQAKMRELAERMVDDPGLVDRIAPRRP